MIELRTITEDNYLECLNLKASVENESFVDPVVYSLAEAWVFYKDTIPFAIYCDSNMVGFVSMYIGEGNHQIINFLIDDAYQNRGLGAAAAKLCIGFLQRACHASRVSVPVEQGNLAAQKFWKKLGFTFSENVENGYLFMRLTLPETGTLPPRKPAEHAGSQAGEDSMQAISPTDLQQEN